jgi:hypothetical protein
LRAASKMIRQQMSRTMQREREQRATFRVAVKSGSGLEVSLQLAGQRWAGKVSDVSAEGMFVKLDRGTVPALRIDSHVDVDIKFDEDAFRLYGVIRSHHAGGYGVFFPERDPAGRANPRARLGRIAAQLQRTDLSQRLKVLKLPE